MDANAKLGAEYVKGDPHPLSKNGEFLKSIIENNNLVVCNGLTNCEGLYTRERQTVNGFERSVIDYIIICQDLYLYYESMKIDSNNALSYYKQKKKEVKISKSDHN